MKMQELTLLSLFLLITCCFKITNCMKKSDITIENLIIKEPFIKKDHPLVEKSKYFTNIFNDFGQPEEIYPSDLSPNIINDIGLRLFIEVFNNNTTLEEHLITALQNNFLAVFKAVNQYQIHNLNKNGIYIFDLLMPFIFNEYTQFIDDHGNYHDEAITNTSFRLLENLQQKDFQNSFRKYMTNLFFDYLYDLDSDLNNSMIINFTAIWKWVLNEIRKNTVPDAVAQLSYNKIKDLLFYHEDFDNEVSYIYYNWHHTLNIVSLNRFPFWINFSEIENEHYFTNIRNISVTDLNILGHIQWGDLKYFVNLTLDSLFTHFSQSTHLEKLNLYANNIIKLPDSIETLQSLQKLYLGKNDLTFLPNSIENLTHLQILDVNENNVSYLSESIGNLTQLQALYLDNNELTSLPDSIGNLALLETLDVEKNYLTSLPDSIGNLTNLRILKVKNNPIRSLPATISRANLPNLIRFKYSSDHLIQDLPLSIIDLKNAGIAIEYAQDMDVD